MRGIVSIMELRQVDAVLLETMYGFVVLFVFFKGGVRKKFQAFVLELIAITAIDLLVWSVFIFFLGSEIYTDGFYTEDYVKWASEMLGCVFWGIAGTLLKKQRNKMRESFESLSFFNFSMILAALIGLAFMAGMAQLNLLEKKNDGLQEAYLIISSSVLVLFILFVSKFIYMVYSKKQLEIENIFTMKYIELQKIYYEKAIENDENIRRFKHDIAKHIGVMEALCSNNEMQGLKEYVKDIGAKYVDAMTQIHTGNLVADYFINQTIAELKKQGAIEFEIIGQFPEKIIVSNSDLCILFGNVMENALEALKKWRAIEN